MAALLNIQLPEMLLSNRSNPNNSSLLEKVEFKANETMEQHSLLHFDSVTGACSFRSFEEIARFHRLFPELAFNRRNMRVQAGGGGLRRAAREVEERQSQNLTFHPKINQPRSNGVATSREDRKASPASGNLSALGGKVFTRLYHEASALADKRKHKQSLVKDEDLA